MVALFGAAMMGGAGPASAAGFDRAADPVYADGILDVNGGSGFGAWQLNPVENSEDQGVVLGDSNTNGDAGGPGINTDDLAFGLYARNGMVTEAIRPFASPLAIGQSFSISFDNGWVEGDDSAQGVVLEDVDGVGRATFVIRAGSSTYLIEDGDGVLDTGIGFTDGGLDLTFLITSQDTYDLTVHALAEDFITVFEGRVLGGNPDAPMVAVRAFNANNFEEGSPGRDLFINNLELGCPDASECGITIAEGSDFVTPGSQNVFAGPENGEEFRWTLESNSSGASIVGPDNQQVVVIDNGGEPGFYDLSLEVVVDGCPQACLVGVTVDSLPAPEAGNNSPICEGEDLVLTASEIENATYTWVGPNLFLSTEQNPVVVSAELAAAGEYSVSASVNGSPSAIATTFVDINPAPECLISGEEVICPGTEQVVYYAPNDLVLYEWTLEGDATYENDPVGGVVRIIPAESGTFTLTLTIQDNNGCAVTCTRTVHIGDNVPPEITCPDEAAVAPGEDYSPDALGYAVAVDSCDGDPVISYSDEEVPGSCAGSTMVIRTWRAEDMYGNVATCEQVIHIQDVNGPTLEIPPSVNLTCGADTSPEALGFASALDDVDGAVAVTYQDEVYVLDCENFVVIERVWTAVDSCGNVSEDLQTITIEDTEAPVMVVPASVQLPSDADTSPEAIGFAVASDNCDGEIDIAFFDEIVEGACEQEYTINRFWFATDPCGNQAEGLQVIQVGNGPVTITVPDEAVFQCTDDLAPESIGFAEAIDGLGLAVELAYVDELIPGDCGGRFIVLRHWQAVDACGNPVEATQTIIIDDAVAPVITPPADATVDCNADISTEALGVATVEDACDEAPALSYSDTITPGEIAGVFTVERVWSAVDACGNFSEAVQVITVSDATAPELVVPADATLACGDDTSVEALGSASATDACDESPVVSYSDAVVPGACAASLTIERTWTAVDANGNAAEAVQTITVTDETAPVLTLPADASIACGASSDPSATGTATATDGCGGDVIITYSDDATESGILRTWTATDACGNAASGVQTITGSADTIAPVLTVPADATVACGADTSVDVLGSATASDGCDLDPAVSFSDAVIAGPCAGSYLIERTWTAEDDNGNTASAVQVITVLDETAPVLTVPADVVLGCGASTAPANTGFATATDACSAPVAVTYADEHVDGSIIRTWTATDACGNASSAEQVIAASGGGGGAPVIHVNPIVATSAFVGQPVNYPMPTATSACDSNVTVVCSPAPGSIKGPGLYQITCTAIDSAGNTSTKKFTLVVLESLRVVVDSPLKDDNKADNIETDADKENSFQVGSTLPVKVRLLDSKDRDMTLLYGLTVSVKLDVSHRQPAANGSALIANLPVSFSGVGWSNGQMAYKLCDFQYNLKTAGYPKGTEKNNTFIRARISVESLLFPGVTIGEEDVLLESKK
ncbi:MAG TPA: hypothetical protein PKC67_06010 [Kiritimatiellia bacterium]|nr:hypothetical protein [Kiritimatiellia bacterium]HMP33889.1 hypothetical protein [Kiritimatiellia bacterium]